MPADFNSAPWGNTDEDGETGYVAVRASTASIAAAKEWLIGDGLDEVLAPDSSRRVVPDGLEPRHLTISIPVDRLDDGELPEVAPVDWLVRSQGAPAWWEFGIYRATEEVPDHDFNAAMAQAERDRAELARARARDDRGPLWWHYLCGVADLLTWAAKRVRPHDQAEVMWREDDDWHTQRVRGWR